MADFDAALRAFIFKYIRSVGHLEVLLLLAKNREHSWTAADVSKELRSNPSYADDQLNELGISGLLLVEEGNERRYRICDDQYLLQQIDILSEAYAVRTTTIINIIYSQPLEKIRGFADAFKLRKD